MSRTVQKTLGQRSQRPARKLDRQAALDQRSRGLSTTEIATLQGVAPSTVRRFMDSMKPELADVEAFKKGRADVFAGLQAKGLNLQHRILTSLEDDRVLGELTPHQKNGLLQTLTVFAGTMYDKERLERGKSTENVSFLGRLLGDSVRGAHKRQAAQAPPEPEQEPEQEQEQEQES